MPRTISCMCIKCACSSLHNSKTYIFMFNWEQPNQKYRSNERMSARADACVQFVCVLCIKVYQLFCITLKHYFPKKRTRIDGCCFCFFCCCCCFSSFGRGPSSNNSTFAFFMYHTLYIFIHTYINGWLHSSHYKLCICGQRFRKRMHILHICTQREIRHI